MVNMGVDPNSVTSVIIFIIITLLLLLFLFLLLLLSLAVILISFISRLVLLLYFMQHKEIILKY